MIINKNKYKEDLLLIYQAQEKFGGEVNLSDISYEIARYKSDDGSIIFYQYTSKAGHPCIRCRINKVLNRKIVDVVLWLQDKTSFDYRFKVKGVSDVWSLEDRINKMLGES